MGLIRVTSPYRLDYDVKLRWLWDRGFHTCSLHKVKNFDPGPNWVGREMGTEEKGVVRIDEYYFHEDQGDAAMLFKLTWT
jgi:hypothetical protein